MTHRATLHNMEETISSPPDDSGIDEARPLPRPCSIVELFEQQESALIRFAYGMVKRREVAEEIVQEGLSYMRENYETFDT